MTKRASLLLVLFVVLTITTLWFHEDANRVKPANELEPVVAETIHIPVKEVSREIEPNTIVESEILTATPSHNTPDKAPDRIIVKGQVKNQLGHGISGMQVEVSPKISSTQEKLIYATITDESGHFLFELIPPDNAYRLEVLASRGYANVLLDIFPPTEDMTALEIILEAIDLTSAEGIVVNADYNPIVNFEFLVQNVGVAYPGRKIVSDSSGLFQLDKFPTGDLHLYTIGDEHFQITGITLQPNEYPNLILVFDVGDYQVSGRVSDAFNNPVPQARVEMTSVVPNLEYNSTSYRFEVTDINGNFKFSNLGGQEHRFVVDAAGYDTHVLHYQFQFLSDNLNIRVQRAQ